jgi:hypothetical protein
MPTSRKEPSGEQDTQKAPVKGHPSLANGKNMLWVFPKEGRFVKDMTQAASYEDSQNRPVEKWLQRIF